MKWIRTRKDGLTEDGHNPMWVAAEQHLRDKENVALARLHKVWPEMRRGDPEIPDWEDMDPNVRLSIAKRFYMALED